MIRTGITFVILLLTPFINRLAAQPEGGSVENTFWLWTLLGRLHPMIVHFPIVLLLAAFMLEMLAWKKKTDKFSPSIKLLVFTGAISSVLAVAFGLLLADSGEYGTELLAFHQWTGIITMLLALVTSFAYLRLSKSFQRVLLILTAAGVTVGGHYGASLTHGEDYLTEMLPYNQEDVAEDESGFVLTKQSGLLDETQVQDINLQVRTIFAHKCTNCHGEAKVKGELRLNSREAVFKGGKNGPILVPGDPGNSELFRRITLPRNHKEAMPNKGKALTKQETDIIEYWIKKGAPWPEGRLKSIYRVASLAPRKPVIPPASDSLDLPVDLFVNEYFNKYKIKWPGLVDDRIYIRRVYLDIIGLLPPADSVEAFISNTAIDKREMLVNNLLNRNDDYAQHWISFWNDALRNDYSGPGYITGGRFGITKWLYTSLQENKPYNNFIKELISPSKESKGFIKGITWRGTINSSQTTAMQAAQNVSQVFLGLNLKCASCHDSFVNDWKLEDAYAFANIFSDSALEIHRCDKPTGKMAGTRILFRELGEIDTSRISKDQMKQLAEYLVQPSNGRIYRTLVNRVWAQLMGRGIIEPVDEMDNSPWSQDLLDWLASDFAENGFDIKHLIRTIVTSKTYQLSSVAIYDAGSIVAKDFRFKGPLRKRMTAEQFTDAVSQVLAPPYGDSVVVYTLLPKGIKKQLPFPRAALIQNDPYLTALGRPNRETVSTSRFSQASLLQALELTNGTRFNSALKKAAMKWKVMYPETEKMIIALYTGTLGRLPTKDELLLTKKILGETPEENVVQDLLWSITLHPEFQLIF